MGHLQMLSAAVSLKAAYQFWAAAEHWLLPGENENIWQAKVTRGLCLYKASIAGPSEHCKVIKHFVITSYINSQQSSGITFPPSHPPTLCGLCHLIFSWRCFKSKWSVWILEGCHVEGCGASFEPEGKLCSPYWQVKEGTGEEQLREGSGSL